VRHVEALRRIFVPYRPRKIGCTKFTVTVEMGSAYARAVMFAADTHTLHLKNCANSSGTVTGWPGRTL
jgi:hypothetical protein